MPSELLPPDAPATNMVLTRRRWAWYFVPGLFVTSILSVGAVVATGELAFVAAPLMVGFLWWLLHRSTPPDGTRHRRMSADPEFFWLFGWAVLTCAGVVLAAEYAGSWDRIIMGFLTGIYFVTMFVLMRRVDRRLKDRKENNGFTESRP